MISCTIDSEKNPNTWINPDIYNTFPSPELIKTTRSLQEQKELAALVSKIDSNLSVKITTALFPIKNSSDRMIGRIENNILISQISRLTSTTCPIAWTVVHNENGLELVATEGIENPSSSVLLAVEKIKHLVHDLTFCFGQLNSSQFFSYYSIELNRSLLIRNFKSEVFLNTTSSVGSLLTPIGDTIPINPIILSINSLGEITIFQPISSSGVIKGDKI